MKLPVRMTLPSAAAVLAATLLLWSVPTIPLRAQDAAPATPAAETEPAAPAPAPAPEAPAAIEAPASPSAPAMPPALEAPAAVPAASAVESAVEAPAPAVPTEVERDRDDDRWDHNRRRHELVTVMGNAHLRADESVPEMVTIMGNAIVDGEVNGDCVTVMGDVTVNGRVYGDLVGIGGTITLGPGAEVRGEVVAVGGGLHLDPTARIRGEKVIVPIFGLSGFTGWIAEWFQDGLGQARVLPHNHTWAWGAAIFIVFLNLLFAVMFREAVAASARAVETRPVFVFVNGALVLLLMPVLFVLLAASVVGIPLVPIAVAGLFLCWFLGTIGIFFFCGQQFGFADRPIVAVLVGNLIFVLLYALPIVGFAVWSVTGLMGLGAAVTAMGTRRREAKEARESARRDELARRAQAPAPQAVTPQVQATPTTPVWMAPPAPVAAPQPPQAPVGATSIGFVGTPPPVMAAASDTTGTTVVPPFPTWTQPESAATPPEPAPGAPFAAAAAAATPAGVAPGVSVPPLPSDEFAERATFWPRFLAFVLDLLAVTIVVNVIGLAYFPLWVLAMVGYHTFFWGWRGTTPGGIVMNLQVVRDDRSPMDNRVAFVRALSGVFSMVPAGLGLIWVAFDRDSLSWHDKLAGTSVVVVRKARPLI